MMVGDTDVSLSQYELIAEQLKLNVLFVPWRADGSGVQGSGLVMIDPEIMGGLPVFAGSRVPIYYVLSSLEQGIEMDRLKAEYPELTSAHVQAARDFARFYPLTSSSWLKVDTIVDVVERRLREGRAPGSGERVNNPG